VAALTSNIQSSEGDTGGANPSRLLGYLANPDPSIPASYVDTRIKTQVACNNSSSSIDESNPDSIADGNATARIDYRFHPWGNQAWAFENPCTPTYYSRIELSPNYPAAIETPSGNTYATDPDPENSDAWKKDDQNNSAFPR
jgi:hypothetical protein